MEVTRRNFLKGAALTAAGAIAAGSMAGCSTSDDAKPATSLPETWDLEADVVVLGYGAAGISAAREACNAGADVLVLEKAPEEFAGGASRCNGGAVLAVAWTPEGLKASSAGAMDDEWCAELSAAAGETIDILVENGGQLMQLNEQYSAFVGGGPAVYEAFLGSVDGLDFRVEYGTAGKRLIVDNGEVKGIQAERDGQEINVKARKAVIIASGQYGSNPEMFNEYCWPDLRPMCFDSPWNDGQGVKMGMAIGAATSKMNGLSLEHYTPGLTKASEESGYNVVVPPYNPAETDARILVNCKGERFMGEEFHGLIHCKETIPYLGVEGNYLAGYPGYTHLPMWLVLDSKYVSNQPIGASKSSGAASWDMYLDLFAWSEDNQEEIEKGWVLKADTLEELAAQMVAEGTQGDERAVDAETLKATVEKWNGYCAGGADLDFGRTSLAPLDTPPYYAAQVTPGIVYTMGGLKPNRSQQTMGVMGEPIPRLYHAGNCGQEQVTTQLGIMGCGGAGMIAGRNAAALEPWE